MRKTDKNAAPDATRKAASKTDVVNITQHTVPRVDILRGFALAGIIAACRTRREIFRACVADDLGTVQQVCMIAKALEQRAALEGGKR